MANRLTQIATEVLSGPGIPRARLTQVACETLVQLNPTGTLASIFPPIGKPGQTVTSTITGSGTHFASGATVVTISGAGVTVGTVTVLSATSLTVVLTMASGASLGARTITVTTGAEAPTIQFTVVALTQRGDIDYDQIRASVRQGPGSMFQMFGGGATTPGHVAVYDAAGNVIDGGTSGGGGGGSLPAWLSTSPDVPPATAGSLDDEFNGSSFDTTRWTWINQGSATAAVANGRAILTAPPGSGDNERLVIQTPPGTPWEVTAKIYTWGGGWNYQRMGLGARDSVSGRHYMLGFEGGGPGKVALSKYNSTTSYNTDVFSYGLWPNFGYFRVRDDGTNVTFSFSLDGAAFYGAFSEGRTNFLTSGCNQIGLVVDSNNSSSPNACVCDWFRRTL